MGEARAGMLLVATPVLLDPNFADTVVLLLDVDENGALGVVLNRPCVVPVAEVLEGWGEVVAEPEVLFHGGPVSTEGALAVASLSRPDDVPVGFREVCGPPRRGRPRHARRARSTAASTGMRIFAGYAGWGAEQLDGEIEEGSWYVVPAEGSRRLPARPHRPVARRAAPPAGRAGLALDAPRRSRPQLTAGTA